MKLDFVGTKYFAGRDQGRAEKSLCEICMVNVEDPICGPGREGVGGQDRGLGAVKINIL